MGMRLAELRTTSCVIDPADLLAPSSSRFPENLPLLDTEETTESPEVGRDETGLAEGEAEGAIDELGALIAEGRRLGSLVGLQVLTIMGLTEAGSREGPVVGVGEGNVVVGAADGLAVGSVESFEFVGREMDVVGESVDPGLTVRLTVVGWREGVVGSALVDGMVGLVVVESVGMVEGGTAVVGMGLGESEGG